jgi:hypothetical protein
MQVDFLPFANTPGADVTNQADWVIDLAPGGDLVDGFPSGIVAKERFNKAIRQATVMSAALANFISDTLAEDVLDDGNLANLISQITQAIQESANEGAWSTGDVKMTYKTVADVGWLMMDNGTIGSATSGATHQGAEFEDLFVLLWTNVSDANAPVVGGRGGSAAADWAANKKLTLTATLGRALAVAGSGAGLTPRALGAALGSENAVVVDHTHTGTANSDGTHSHTLTYYVDLGGGGGAGRVDGVVPGVAVGTSNAGAHTHVLSIANSGVSGTGANMPPETFLNVMIKL